MHRDQYTLTIRQLVTKYTKHFDRQHQMKEGELKLKVFNFTHS